MSIAHPPIPFRRAGQKYAFVVVAVVFLALLVSAGLRSSPSVLLVPLEESFGWSRSTTSFSAAVGIFLYGLVGPLSLIHISCAPTAQARLARENRL